MTVYETFRLWQRVAKTSSTGLAAHYVYGELGMLLGEYDAAGLPQEGKVIVSVNRLLKNPAALSTGRRGNPPNLRRSTIFLGNRFMRFSALFARFGYIFPMAIRPSGD
ncbi:hypothetical protein, partial [Massilia sp. TWR1-2-2]|uniref:hypothetical protein n=1 Tax=Massilia sp. TWR1-2-2 TaxID=2804584 RepID=UPI003CFB37AA